MDMATHHPRAPPRQALMPLSLGGRYESLQLSPIFQDRCRFLCLISGPETLFRLRTPGLRRNGFSKQMTLQQHDKCL